MQRKQKKSCTIKILGLLLGFFIFTGSAYAAPDLYFKKIAITVAKRFDGLIGYGSPITANYTIASTGGNVTKDFIVRIYLCPSKSATGCINAYHTDLLVKNTITATGVNLSQHGGFPVNTKPGPQYIRVVLDATSQVAESDENNNVFYQALDVTCKPDVQTSLSLGMSVLYPGDKLSGVYTLSNSDRTGCAFAQNVRTGIYWSRDGRWDSGDTLLGSYTASQVVSNKGSSHTFSLITPSNLSNYGSGYILAVADDNKKIPELNESNNVGNAYRFTFRDPRPDLSITLSPSYLVVDKDQTISLIYKITNNGHLDAGPFTIGFLGVGVNTTVPITSLKTGASYRASAKIPLKMINYKSGQTYNIVATADSAKKIDEKIEYNNTASMKLYPRATIDAVIQNLRATPNPQAPGGTLTVTADITTKSYFASPSFNFEVYWSDVNFATYSQFLRDRRKVLLKRQGVPAGRHKPNEKIRYTATVKIPGSYKPGPIYIYGIASVGGDKNPNDNWLKTTVTVSLPKPDLIPTVLTAPKSIIAGQKLTVTYTVKNQGKGNAGAHTVGLYLSKDAQITAQDNLINVANHSGPAVGKSYNGTISVTTSKQLSPAYKYIGVLVDSTSKVSESSETNNSRSQAFLIQVDKDGDGVTADKDCNDNDKTVYPGAKEICDNKDNNCNKQVDETLTQTCYTAPNNTKNLGLCKAGTAICKAGKWQTCVGQITPKVELCDNKDNDCNGKVDDSARTSISCPAGNRKGVCAFGRGICQNGKEVCVYNKPTTERCDKRDNDCNGKIDDNPACNPPIDCYTKGCPTGKVCLMNRCIPNPCATVRCGAGSYCLLGRCIKRCECPHCPPGEVCLDGRCQRNPCGGKQACRQGEVCNQTTGLCTKNTCPSQGCGAKRSCINGRCQDDPCSHVTCGSGYRCWFGQCQRTTCGQEPMTEPTTEPITEMTMEPVAETTMEPTTETAIEPVAEPSMDAGLSDQRAMLDTNNPKRETIPEQQAEPTVPEAKNGKEQAKRDEDNATNELDSSPQSGCSCTQNDRGEIPWMGLFGGLFLLLAIRRKKRKV